MSRFRLLLIPALLQLASLAHAAPISGQISINGYAQAVGSTGMGAATGISFANGSGTIVSGTSGMIVSYGAGSGSFAAIGSCASGSCGVDKNIFSLLSSPPISNFLSLNSVPTVSFDLSSISNINRNSSANSISFTGLGTIHFAGFDDTPGSFFLTAQGDNITSFSGTISAGSTSSVPEPASVLVVSASLGALAWARRRKA